MRVQVSLLAQTLNNFMQIKAKALGHRRKPVKQVVSSGAPRQFHKLLSWFEANGRIIVNFMRHSTSARYWTSRLERRKTSKAKIQLNLEFQPNVYPRFQRTSCMAELQTCPKSPWRDCFLGPKPCWGIANFRQDGNKLRSVLYKSILIKTIQPGGSRGRKRARHHGNNNSNVSTSAQG